MPPKQPSTKNKAPRTTRLRWPLLGLVALAVLIWIGFFDSHSLLRRVQWSQERAQLREENRRLVQDIEQVQRDLQQVDSPEVIEKVAREQYGMRKPGETVYRVESKE